MNIHDWKALHHEAYNNPAQSRENWIVSLVRGIELSVMEYHAATNGEGFPDGVISEYFGQIIQGARGLLNADFGTRLDGGTLDSKLYDLGDIVRYDLDIDEVKWAEGEEEE